jgi:hypothetical protein
LRIMSGKTMLAVAGLTSGAERRMGDPPLGVVWCDLAVDLEVESVSVGDILVGVHPPYAEPKAGVLGVCGVRRIGDAGELGDAGDGVRDARGE